MIGYVNDEMFLLDQTAMTAVKTYLDLCLAEGKARHSRKRLVHGDDKNPRSQVSEYTWMRLLSAIPCGDAVFQISRFEVDRIAFEAEAPALMPLIRSHSARLKPTISRSGTTIAR